MNRFVLCAEFIGLIACVCVTADQAMSDDSRKDCEETTTFPKHIPEDIILNILPRLRVKSLVRFRSVCKIWKSIIDDPSFVDIHSAHAHSRIVLSFYKQGTTHLYSANLAEGPAVPLLNLPGFTQQDIANARFHVLESLNGLLLLTTQIYYPREYYYICNPSTGKLLMLPPSEWCSYKECNIVQMHSEYYFGYDHINKKYKVLHLYEIGCYIRRGNFYGSTKGFEMYTLGGTGWQVGSIDETTFNRIRYNIVDKSVCLHGIIHWIITRRRKEVINLVAFDLQSEVFRLTPLPRALSDDYFRLYQEYYTESHERRPPRFHLDQACDHLVILYHHDKDDLMNISLWVLEDYENNMWVRKNVQLPCRPTLSLCPNASTQTVEIILDWCSFPLDRSFKPLYLKARADGVFRVRNLPEWIIVCEEHGVGRNYFSPPADRVSFVTYFVESLVPLEGALSEHILLPNRDEDAGSDDEF